MKSSKCIFLAMLLLGLAILQTSCGDDCRKEIINLKIELISEIISIKKGESFDILCIIENITNVKNACNNLEGEIQQTDTEMIIEYSANGTNDFETIEETIIATEPINAGDKIENQVSFQFDKIGIYKIYFTTNKNQIAGEEDFSDNEDSIIIEVTD